MFEVRVTVEAPDVCAAVRELAAAMAAAPAGMNCAVNTTIIRNIAYIWRRISGHRSISLSKNSFSAKSITKK